MFDFITRMGPLFLFTLSLLVVATALQARRWFRPEPVARRGVLAGSLIGVAGFGIAAVIANTISTFRAAGAVASEQASALVSSGLTISVEMAGLVFAGFGLLLVVAQVASHKQANRREEFMNPGVAFRPAGVLGQRAHSTSLGGAFFLFGALQLLTWGILDILRVAGGTAEAMGPGALASAAPIYYAMAIALCAGVSGLFAVGLGLRDQGAEAAA